MRIPPRRRTPILTTRTFGVSTTNVLGTIVTIIAHTPLWVWGLYVALLFLGLQRTSDSSVPLWHVLILPIAVALLAISSVIGASPRAWRPRLLVCCSEADLAGRSNPGMQPGVCPVAGSGSAASG